MARKEPDKSSKWLIQHHGDIMLQLAGLPKVRRWQAKQAEIVQPATLPDGLLEVWFQGQKQKEHVVLEVAAYSEKRYMQQAVDDLVMAYKFLDELPEMLMLVLVPKGQYRISGVHEIESRLKTSRITVHWKVVELWTVSAEDLFALNEVGIIPWIPLAQFDDPPEVILERCRQRIDEQAPPQQKEQLLAVSHVLGSLRYNDEQLLALFGGMEGMTEFPLIQKFIKQATQNTKHEDILRVLQARFKELPDDLPARVRRYRSEKKLNSLLDFAAQCNTLEDFLTSLRS